MVMNKTANEKVIGALIKKPELLTSNEFPLKVDDFGHRHYKMLYSAIYNLFVAGSNSLTSTDIEGMIAQNPAAFKDYKENNIVEILTRSESIADIDNYSYYYNIVKKNALLTDLSKNGIDISSLYNPTLDEKSLEKQLSKLNALTIKDVINHFKTKVVSLEDKYENFMEKSGIVAGDGIDELLNSLQEKPEVGIPLNGDIMNMITRGARKKKLYLNSSSTSGGKSRTAAGNAAKLGFPQFYDTEEEKWIDTEMDEKVLFITTELEHSEVQTLFLAFLSGVDEAKILDNKYDSRDEAKRVRYAANLIKQNENVFIEHMPNPSIEGVATKIKTYVLQHDVEYVFYDYIHVSSATYMEKRDMRDDVWLMLFADRLKQLCNELDIHISTATQVNGDYEDKEVKNQNLIRGAKSVADKIDIGCITTKIVNPKEMEHAAALAAQHNTPVPNMILDVYKNRRGKWTNVRVWRNTDLGTCRSIDCFVTDIKGDILDVKQTMIKIQSLEAEGAFPIYDPATGDIVENRREVRPNEF